MSKPMISDQCRFDNILRQSFFECTETVFPGVNFRDWYARGYWKNEYTPYAVVENDRVVAVVAATTMKLIINGKPARGVQIGTVGTLPEYRGRGLSRLLMEYVLDKYKALADIFFLYADDDVFDFYRKFGFTSYDELVFKAESNIPQADYGARSLDIGLESDMALVQSLLNNRKPLTTIFGATDYDFITWWHVLNMYPDSLLYVEDINAVFIVTEKNECLHVWEVIHCAPIDMSSALPKVMKHGTPRSIRYYFPPDQLPFEYDDTEIDVNSPIFVRGSFPIGKNRFKFPTTAHT